jgi:hypothetical protein
MNDCSRKKRSSAVRGLYATRRQMLLQAGAGFGMLAWWLDSHAARFRKSQASHLPIHGGGPQSNRPF